MKIYIRSAVRLFKDEPELIKYKATRDPATPAELLTELYTDPDITDTVNSAEYLADILIHPNTSDELRNTMLADNPDFETNIYVDFWSEDRDFPIKEFETRLIDTLSNSRFGNNLKYYQYEAEDKPIQMDSGAIAYYFSIKLFFIPIPDFDNAKKEIYDLIDALVESMGAHPHMHSFSYNYGNHWRNRG